MEVWWFPKQQKQNDNGTEDKVLLKQKITNPLSLSLCGVINLNRKMQILMLLKPH